MGGVVEEQHHVELVVGDTRADLLISAVGIGEEAVYAQSGGLGDLMSGGIGGVEVVLGENPGVGGTELYHEFLLVIVCHKRDIHAKSSLTVAACLSVQTG